MIDAKPKLTRPYTLPKDRAIYNYRYFLPYAPEWGTEEFCEKRLQELLDFCGKAGIDAVQFFVNTLPGTYYMPAHDAREQEHWARWMRDAAAPALRGMGVSYQLNLQMLLGASTYGLDMRDEYEWEFLVNQHGEETLGCACPLSPGFREQMGEMLRLWASTGPDIVWIDDDLRMHNHGTSVSELDFYCYCERHLNVFAKSVGRSYSREELVAEVLRPGRPSLLRQQWLDFIGETMTETAGWIREQVQGVSPFTRLAQMTSAPDVHSVEGRDWKSFLTALSGGYAPITRPCSGVYTGAAVPVRYQAVTFRFMEQSIAVLEQVFGPDVVEYGPELENTRFTTWCKSVGNSEYVLILGQLLGCQQMTLSLNDLDGSPIDEEPTTVPLLRENKPRLQALADLQLRSWDQQGVAFISDPDSARKVEVGKGAIMQDLGLIREWEDTLLQMGIPAKYVSPAEASVSDDVVALEEYTAWCASDDELRGILSGAALLDGGAARVIQHRGFGDLLGVSVGQMQSYGITAERYADDVLPGVHSCRVPHRGMKWYELELAAARLTSEFIDAKNRYHVGSAIYENSLGGRVAVYAGIGDLSPYGSFGSHARLRWLHGILRWLSRDKFRVLPVIPHHGLTVVRSEGDRTLIGFANLGTDVLKEVIFRLQLAGQLENVAVLDRSGTWQKVSCDYESDASTLTVPCELNAFEWLILVLRSANP